jgi:hypothetical protein
MDFEYGIKETLYVVLGIEIAYIYRGVSNEGFKLLYYGYNS